MCALLNLLYLSDSIEFMGHSLQFLVVLGEISEMFSVEWPVEALRMKTPC